MATVNPLQKSIKAVESAIRTIMRKYSDEWAVDLKLIEATKLSYVDFAIYNELCDALNHLKDSLYVEQSNALNNTSSSVIPFKDFFIGMKGNTSFINNNQQLSEDTLKDLMDNHLIDLNTGDVFRKLTTLNVAV